MNYNDHRNAHCVRACPSPCADKKGNIFCLSLLNVSLCLSVCLSIAGLVHVIRHVNLFLIHTHKCHSRMPLLVSQNTYDSPGRHCPHMRYHIEIAFDMGQCLSIFEFIHTYNSSGSSSSKKQYVGHNCAFIRSLRRITTEPSTSVICHCMIFFILIRNR